MEQTQVPSPVPGLNIEAATLLVQAVKARRRYFSKQTTSQSAADDAGGATNSEEEESKRQSALEELKNTVDDKSTELLNELKRQVQAASRSGGRRREEASAPVKCAEFLIETLSDSENSFRLRRAALATLLDILVRSSDSRAFLATGRHLLDFVAMIEAVSHQNDGQDARQEQSVFQLEAIELVQEMAAKFGQIYTQFTVAGRLLGDVSTECADDVASQRSKNMSLLRRERDAALEHGPKACETMRRMTNRADGYFRVLVPRFGGFAKAGGETTDGESILDNDEELKGDDLSDDDSVDWEEGELGLEEDDGDHELAVDQTLDILKYSGALLDGSMAIKIGAPADDETAFDQRQLSETRQKLQVLVDKLSKRQPRLKQWILALSKADGMEERTLRDPANSTTGPTSLVLISEQKRSRRSEVLRNLLSVRNEMDHIVEAAARLGINATKSSEVDTNEIIDPSRKRQCLPEPKIVLPTDRKKRGRKRSRYKVKVFYKKK